MRALLWRAKWAAMAALGRCVIDRGTILSPTTEKRLARLDALASQLRERAGRPLKCLEIGSLFGHSARVLARYGWVFCVDPWPRGFSRFRHSTRGLNVVPIRARSEDILPYFGDGVFDLAYVDGDHVWPAPYRDLCWCLRLVGPGGCICGDDLERQLSTAEDFSRAQSCIKHDWRDGFHPGVSLAVARLFGHVKSEDGFWWRVM